MLLCAITDRHLVAKEPARQQDALAALARTWAENGVSLVQLREKDLPAAELISLAQAMLGALRATGAATRLILNAPLDVVLAAGADGIHLPADASSQSAASPSLAEMRSRFAARSTLFIGPMPAQHLWISVACHTLEEVERARGQKADVILFAPVFEKQLSGGQTLPGQGLAALADACRTAYPVPVLALGGITAANAAACLAAGASGIAAIRLFHGAAEGWRTLASQTGGPTGGIDAAPAAP